MPLTDTFPIVNKVKNQKTESPWDILDEATKKRYTQQFVGLYLALKNADEENKWRKSSENTVIAIQETDAMIPETNRISFDGKILRRGFWLYVWQVLTKDATEIFYIGRTGDSSSNNAQSAFNRMSQHLGNSPSSNMLRKYIEKSGLNAVDCQYQLITCGPLFEEARNSTEHTRRRNKIAALEKGLAEAMAKAGYAVLNTVKSTHNPDEEILRKVIEAFSENFPKLHKL